MLSAIVDAGARNRRRLGGDDNELDETTAKDDHDERSHSDPHSRCRVRTPLKPCALLLQANQANLVTNFPPEKPCMSRDK